MIFFAFILLILLVFYGIRNKEGFESSNLILYIHICQKENWEKAFSILINSIKESGLYDNLNEIRLGIVNDDSKKIENDLLNDDKFNIVFIKNSSEYERPTLLHMKKMSYIDKPNTLYCYLHTKGISHFNTKNEPDVLKWINGMLECNIYDWKNVIVQLKMYETYGCNYTDEPKPHYSGNFWWATSNHIQKLPDVIEDYYTAPEMWVLMNKDNMYCKNNCGDNFVKPYPAGFY